MLDEDYFRTFVLIGNREDEAARELWDGPVLRQIRNREFPAFGNRVRSQIGQVELYSRGGVFLGKEHALSGETDRIRRVLGKIIGGLVWHHGNGHIVSPDVPVKLNYVTVGQPPEPDVAEFARSLPDHSIGGGRVMYRISIASTTPTAHLLRWGSSAACCSSCAPTPRPLRP